MTTFKDLMQKWTWKPYQNCPGRYHMPLSEGNFSPEELVDKDVATQTYDVPNKDPVIVAKFEGGGLITYKKPNGRYLHTLNTEEGFKRKLGGMGIFLK